MWKRSLFFVVVCASFCLGVCGAERLLADGPGWGYLCTDGAGTTCPPGSCTYNLGTCTTCGPKNARCKTASKCSSCDYNAVWGCCINHNSCAGWDFGNGVGCDCDANDLPHNGPVYFCKRPPSVRALFASR